MDSDIYSSSSSRCSSVCGSLASRKSAPIKPRRIVGDVVRISSYSKVYVNATETHVPTPLVNVNNEDNNNCDNKSAKMVSDSLKDSKDLPKIRNKIFEESLESQEISYYIDDFYDDPKSETDADSDSFESESDIEETNEIGLYQNIENIPLPLPPAEPNTLNKFAENVKKIRKTISKDFSKSLRRISRRISQAEPTVPNSVPSRKLSAKEETPADIVHVSALELRQPLSRDEDVKPAGLLSRIKRSMSLSSEGSAFSLYGRNDSQRKSTFYLTDPINIDICENSTEEEIGNTIIEEVPEQNVEKRIELPPDIIRSSKKAKVSRPKSPPPPIPITQDRQTKQSDNRTKSLYAVPGFLKLPLLKEQQNRKTWYAETTKISPKTEYATPVKTKTYSTVIEELNFKLNGSNTIEDFTTITDNESTYNNQSVRSFGSSKTDESSLIMDPALEFLQGEPLYQFYDAAVLESVYSDDSSDFEDEDIYEDVVQSNDDNLSRELDFINQNFNVTRSLWCEIPEVKKSAVLSQLSTQQKKLQEAKFEVITSEASYLNSLNVLSNHFVPSFKKSNIINEKELEILFGKLKAVRNCSKKMLYDLERCWKSNILIDGICDLIQKHAQENFDAYIPYCENQVIINETLTHMKERPGFKEFLEQVESSSSCQYLSLYSFLMLPMQRITRWPLLADAILKRLSESDPEYLTCQHALTTLNKIVSQCNEAARKKEREVELVRISNNLCFPRGVPYTDIIDDNRWLLRSGTLTWLQPRNDEGKVSFGKKINKMPLTLFLFNDFFMVTKKEGEVHSVLHYCPRNLIELRDIDTYRIISRKDINEKNILYLCLLENQDGRLIEFLLSSPTETDKERWMEAFSPPKSEDPDETLYECWDCPQVTVLHSYNACQPDELSLTRGDVINVLRKMSDGWYHGERIRDGVTGWFPSNYTNEIINPHVRARNLKQRYRLLTFSENYLKS